MATAQESLRLLDDPIALELLQSTIPARLAYQGLDGNPRVVPIWFHWTGEEVVFATPPAAPKVKALEKNPDVCVTIDSNTNPYKVLQIRGRAHLEKMDDVVPEYAEAATRYNGPEAGPAWIAQLRQMGKEKMVRISVRPRWVGIIDFVTRFPSALT